MKIHYNTLIDNKNTFEKSTALNKWCGKTYTRQFTPAQVDIRRTDPHMIALYGNGTSNRNPNNEISGG